jgi:hypothetical protein
MSNVIKLLTISLLLIGCTGMYGNSTSKAPKNHGADNHTAKHVTNHVNNVNNAIAASASATSTLAKQLPLK